MNSQPIASLQFKDGTSRPVYEDDYGQYVFDNEGDPIYSVWYVPPQEIDAKFGPQPIIVCGDSRTNAKLNNRDAIKLVTER